MEKSVQVCSYANGKIYRLRSKKAKTMTQDQIRRLMQIAAANGDMTHYKKLERMLK